MNDKKSLNFQCNICGSKTISNLSELSREVSSCQNCGSSVRMRSVIHLLSLELFGESIILPEFPKRKDLHGVGMSDWETYAKPLTEKLDYTNTFYHQEPKLDITNISDDQESSMDFIISSDVYEHVLYPVNRAFINTLRLLKPNGVFIFTAPYSKEGEETVERFGTLHDFDIKLINNEYVLTDIMPDGTVIVHRDLIFHGGPGSTLEMRVFSEKSIISELKNAGFVDIKIHNETFMKYGIYCGAENWSLPITARSRNW